MCLNSGPTFSRRRRPAPGQRAPGRGHRDVQGLLVAGPSHTDIQGEAGSSSLHLVFVIPCQSPAVNIILGRATEAVGGRACCAEVAGAQAWDSGDWEGGGRQGTVLLHRAQRLHLTPPPSRPVGRSASKVSPMWMEPGPVNPPSPIPAGNQQEVNVCGMSE